MLGGLIATIIGSFSGSGIVPTITKIGLQFSAPLVFVFFRFLFATVIFLPVLFFTKRKKLSRNDYGKFAILAFFLFVNVTFFTIGVKLTTVIMSQLLYLPTPIVVSILGHFFLHEKLNRHKIFGLFIALCGVLFLMYQSLSKHSSLTFGTPLGNSIILIAMLGYSGWLLYSRSLAKRQLFNSYETTFFTFAFIALYLLLLLPFEQMLVPSVITWIMPKGVLFAGFVSLTSVFQYFFLQIGIKRTNAFTASMFQYVGPVFAGLISVPFLGEKPSGLFFIGGAIIVGGVFYATTYDFLTHKIKK